MHGNRRENHLGKRIHDIAHLCRVKFHTHWILHPCVCNKNPQCGKRCPYCRKPGSSQVEPGADLVPAKKHNGNKCGFHKKGNNTLNGKRSTEYIAHKPGIVTPVCTKFKLKNNTCCHAHGKVYTEQQHPELGYFKPFCTFCPHIYCFHNGNNNGYTQSKRHKQPVIHGSQGKLCPRPVDNAH